MADINTQALEILGGAQTTPPDQETQIGVETDPVAQSVETPIVDDINEKALNIFSAAGGLNRETKEAPEAPEERRAGSNLMSRAVIAGIPVDGFSKRFAKNLTDNPFTRGLTALPRAIIDAPSDIREAGEGISERSKERGDVLAELMINTDMSDFGEAQELIKETANQVLGTTVDYIGAIFMTAMKLPFTQSTEDKIGETFGKVGTAVAESEIPNTGGKTVADAVTEIGKAWDEYEARNPEGARSYRLAGNFLQFGIDVLTGGLARKPVQKGFQKVVGLELGTVELSVPQWKQYFKQIPKAERPSILQRAKDLGKVGENEAEQIARSFGIELPASATTSGIASKGEQLLGEGLFGGQIKKRAEKAVSKFDDIVTEIEKEAPSSATLGETVSNRFKEVEAAYNKTIKDLYNAAEELADTTGVTTVFKQDSPTVKLLDDLIERKALAEEVGVASPELPFLRILRKGFNETQSVAQRRAVLKEIGEKANFQSFNPTTEEKIFRKLYGSLKKDFDTSLGEVLPQMKKPLAEANALFRKFKDIEARPFVQKVKKLTEKGDFDKIAEFLTKTNVSANEIRIMYETLGSDIKLQLQRKFLSNIIGKSRRAGGDGFTPTGFSRQMKAIGEEKLNIIFSPKQVKLLKNLDTLNQALAKSSALTRGSQTALLQNMNLLRGGVGFATGGTSLVAEYMLAEFFGGKMGQRVLKSFGRERFKEMKSTLTKAKF